MKTLLTIFALILGSDLFAQEKWNDPTEIRINYDTKKALAFVGVSDKQVLSIKSLPQKMLISIPSDGIEDLRIRFNKKTDKNSFILASNCTDEKDCVSFNLLDLANGTLELTFYEDQLIKIGNRVINPRKISKNDPYIELLESNKAAAKPANTSKVKQEILGDVNVETLNEYVRCFLCTSFPTCGGIENNNLLSEINNYQMPLDNEPSKTKSKRKYYSYICEVDPISGVKQWFKRDVNGNETLIQNTAEIRPIAGSEIHVKVKGLDTIKYVINISGESYFMEGQGDFKKVFFPEVVKSTNTETSTSDSSTFVKHLDSVQVIIDKESLSSEMFLKARLLALDKILERFNSDFATIDFKLSEYRGKLAILQQSIKTCIGVPLTDSEDDLGVALKSLANNENEKYADEFDRIIKAIKIQYKSALNKSTHRKLFYFSRQVPDEDRLTLSLQSEKSNDKILDYNFRVKGGFKIDFSSGFFINGLGNSEYVLQKFNFLYRETVDTVIVLPGGEPKDSIMYTGNIKSTSGNFIAKNKNKLNYGIGFFAHAYRRSGRTFNWGLGLGGALNSNGQLTAMLGVSTMLHSGKGSRIALTGGACYGKVKKLATAEREFLVKDEYLLHSNSQIPYASTRDVPKFYDTGGTTTINTYEKGKISWFIGLTFNLASVEVKSK